MVSARKNQLVPLTIEGYSSDGDGVARLDGMAVFVKGASGGRSAWSGCSKWAGAPPGAGWRKCALPPLPAKAPTVPPFPSAAAAACGT